MRDSLLEKVAKGGAAGLLSSLFQGKWTKGLGGTLKEMAGRAAMQAGTGALVGGVANKVRGGSFGSGALSGAMGGFTGGSLGSGLVNNPKKQWLGDVIGGALGGGLAGAMVPPAIQSMGMEPGSMPNLEGMPQAGFNKYSFMGVGPGKKYRKGQAPRNINIHPQSGAAVLAQLLGSAMIPAGVGALSAGPGNRMMGAAGGLVGGTLGGAAGALGGAALGGGVGTGLGALSKEHRPVTMLAGGLAGGAAGSGLGGLAGGLYGAYRGGKYVKDQEEAKKPAESKKEEPKKEEPKKEPTEKKSGILGGLGGGAIGAPLGAMAGAPLGEMLARFLAQQGMYSPKPIRGFDSRRSMGPAGKTLATAGRRGGATGFGAGAMLGAGAGAVAGHKLTEPKKEAPKKEEKPEKKETPKEKKAMANEALETLFNQVYLPAFLEKAAELNLNITTPDELEKVLDTTARVKQAMVEDKSNSFTEVANAAKGLAEIPNEKEAEEQPSHSQISQFLATNPQMLQALSAAQA